MAHNTRDTIFGQRPPSLHDRIAKQAETIRRWARQYACLQVAFDQVTSERDSLRQHLTAEQRRTQALLAELSSQREELERLRQPGRDDTAEALGRAVGILRAALELYADDEVRPTISGWRAAQALDQARLEVDVAEQARHTASVVELAAMRRLPPRARPRG
jgi:chromosome segregation ATPase